MIIAEQGDIKIDVPRDVWYSFFNSPYIGHKLGTALDIYFRDYALFPLAEGFVIKIREVKPPQKFFKGKDFVIIFRITNNLCLKVLHVRPTIKVGEKVSLGDEIGEMVESGFFMPWSSKHMHMEIRYCKDSIRARGGLLLRPIILSNVPHAREYEFKIMERYNEFCWAMPRKTEGYSMTPITSNGHGIEGGLPHYGYGALFSKDKKLNVFGQTIKVERAMENVGLFKTNFQIFANNRKIKGIGIYCNQPRIKIIGGCENMEDEVEITAKSFSQKG